MEASLGDSEPRADGAGEPGGGRLEAAPGLARIAAGAWLRTAGWTAGSRCAPGGARSAPRSAARTPST